MKKTITILFIGLLLISTSVFAEDVSIDENGNLTVGSSNTDANLEVMGLSGEDAIIGSASGTSAAGVYGEHRQGLNTNFGILGYDRYGVYGYSFSGWAGYFSGDARVTGNLTVDGTFNATISETDPVFSGHTASGITSGQIINWNTAYGWGNHSGAGYITSESDPTVNSLAKAGLSCSQDQIVKWDGIAWVCSSLSPLCNPGDFVNCYTGLPVSTMNIGECRPGIRTCNSGGSFGNCIGNIIPDNEICDDSLDNDCDGTVDSLDTDCEEEGFALDYTVCPGSNCASGFSTLSPLTAEDRLDNKTLTFEAWVKPKAASTGTVLYRGSTVRGARLGLIYTPASTSTPASMKPSFKILRSVISVSSPSGTSTASYVAEGTAIIINAWVHIAGILTDQDHSTAHAVCTNAAPDGDPRDDPWHLDIYQNGTYTDCAGTYGKNTAAGDVDPTSAAAAYADEPNSLNAGPGVFSGIIDEARIWTVERSSADMDLCRNTELSLSTGTCSYNDSDNIILYVRFNEGSGYLLTDFTGTFNGALEYPDGSGGFLEWDTGWTNDTPF